MTKSSFAELHAKVRESDDQKDINPSPIPKHEENFLTKQTFF